MLPKLVGRAARLPREGFGSPMLNGDTPGGTFVGADSPRVVEVFDGK